MPKIFNLHANADRELCCKVIEMQTRVMTETVTNTLHKRVIMAFVFFASCILSFGDVARADKNTADKNNESVTPPASLQLAASLSTNGTTLACILTNKSSKDIPTLPMGNVMSHLVVTYPNGDVKRLISPIDHLDIQTVKPSQAKTWRAKVSDKIGKYAFTEPGLYRFHWEWQEFDYNNQKSFTDTLASTYHVSNEILLLKE